MRVKERKKNKHNKKDRKKERKKKKEKSVKICVENEKRKLNKTKLKTK